MKTRGLPLILIDTRLNSLRMYMKLRLRLELGKVNLNKETRIYKVHICNVASLKIRVLP